MGWGRIYFAVQAVAGAMWWVAVFTSPFVCEATLGSLDPVVVALLDIPLFVGASALAAGGLRAAAVVTTAWTNLVLLALAVYATVTTEAGWGVVAMAGASAGSVLALTLVIFGRVPTSWLLRGPFAFRPAVVAPRPLRYVVTTFAQVAIFWLVFLAGIPIVAVALERRWGLALPFPAVAAPVGVGVFVMASALGIWSAVTMSTRGAGTPLPAAMPNRLVVAGPYLWVRNPMAVASIVQGIAVGLMLSSWLVVVYAIAGALLWNYAIRPHEEADLEQRFGHDFRRYRDSVRCWIPQLPGVLGRAYGPSAGA